MMGNLKGKLHYRKSGVDDGPQVWEMVKKSGSLDLNSSYYYLVMCHWFSDSCRLVEETGTNSLVGLITGFRQPSNPSTIFVWQVAVDEKYRGGGIAINLLNELTNQPDISFVEATISPSNQSSKRLFEKWAIARNCPIHVSSGFSEDCFPDEHHEREDLYRIGPFN